MGGGKEKVSEEQETSDGKREVKPRKMGGGGKPDREVSEKQKTQTNSRG